MHLTATHGNLRLPLLLLAIVGLLLCALLMPDMAMSAVAGCIATVFVVLAFAFARPSSPQPSSGVAERDGRAARWTLGPTGPPVLMPLRI